MESGVEEEDVLQHAHESGLLKGNKVLLLLLLLCVGFNVGHRLFHAASQRRLTMGFSRSHLQLFCTAGHREMFISRDKLGSRSNIIGSSMKGQQADYGVVSGG